MNVLTKDQLIAFCKPRGLAPRKKTAKAYSYELGVAVNVGERRPAKYVVKIGPDEYIMHPTAAGGRVLAEQSGSEDEPGVRDHGGWIANSAEQIAAFIALLEESNPIKTEVAA